VGTPQVSVTRVRVRYAETDQMNVVYYANYFVWFEVGRTELLRGLGWSYREMEAEGYSLPVIEASCQYLRPAQYDDELQITTTGTLLSPVRLVFDYAIDRANDRIVTGRTAHASLNPQGRPVRLPDRVRTFFA
jgi:acyl-CoA thioester hydrolase